MALQYLAMARSLPKSRKCVLAMTFVMAFFSSCAQAGLLDAQCMVVGITDGDTFKARCPYEQITVRFAAIDAPERSQAFGQVSRQYLAKLIFGKTVRVSQTKESQSYNRVVANVFDEHGQDVGLMMVRAGLAWHYKQYAREQTLSERSTYTLAENEAKKSMLGLWIDEHPQAPWQFRRK